MTAAHARAMMESPKREFETAPASFFTVAARLRQIMGAASGNNQTTAKRGGVE